MNIERREGSVCSEVPTAATMGTRDLVEAAMRLSKTDSSRSWDDIVRDFVVHQHEPTPVISLPEP